MDVVVCSPDEAELSAGPWDVAGLALLPQRLHGAAVDRRWEATWVIAREDGRILGYLPLYRMRGDVVAETFDPRKVAPAIARDGPEDAGRWLYVAGFQDLTSGVAVAAVLDPARRQDVRQALVAEAFAVAERTGLVPIALYVRDAELSAFRAALGDAFLAVPVQETAVLELPDGDFAGFVAALPKRDRYRVRQELGQLASLGIRAEEVDPVAMIAEAAQLILVTKQNHGMLDHPAVIRMRLAVWAASGADEQRAFAVRDAAGRAYGVSFASVYGDVAELYELGLRRDVEHRHLSYVELMAYAPARYALRQGCRRLLLGPGSCEPKARRGARLEPVWAVTAGGPPWRA